MKPCAECKGWSPHDAAFCIECSAPFAATGATERLTPYPQSGMGCSVYKVTFAGGNQSGSVFIPIRIIPGVMLSSGSASSLGSANSFFIGDIGT
mgnify:CR=1 FL=1